MTKANAKDDRYAVAVLVISPAGHYYEQSSLKQCAAFVSELHSRISGTAQAYYDHSAIRAKLSIENGEFGGVLSGWRLIEFPSLTALRSYMWDCNGVPRTDASIDQTGNTELQNDRSVEQMNQRREEGENDRRQEV